MPEHEFPYVDSYGTPSVRFRTCDAFGNYRDVDPSKVIRNSANGIMTEKENKDDGFSPTTWYTEKDLVLRGIGHESQRVGRDSGKLKYRMAGHDFIYKGSDVTSWFEGSAITKTSTARTAPATSAAAPAIPPRNSIVAKQNTQNTKQEAAVERQQMIHAFNLMVCGELQRRGDGDRRKAIATVSRKEPELHRLYLESVNPRSDAF